MRDFSDPRIDELLAFLKLLEKGDVEMGRARKSAVILCAYIEHNLCLSAERGISEVRITGWAAHRLDTPVSETVPLTRYVTCRQTQNNRCSPGSWYQRLFAGEFAVQLPGAPRAWEALCIAPEIRGLPVPRKAARPSSLIQRGKELQSASGGSPWRNN